MPAPYELFIRHEVYHELRAASRPSRNRILTFMESLPADPFQSGDYSEADETGRPCQVKIIGKYAMYFWTDHAAKPEGCNSQAPHLAP